MTNEVSKYFTDRLESLDQEAAAHFASASTADEVEAGRIEFFTPGSGRYRAFLSEIFAMDEGDRAEPTAALNASIDRIGGMFRDAKGRLATN